MKSTKLHIGIIVLGTLCNALRNSEKSKISTNVQDTVYLFHRCSPLSTFCSYTKVFVGYTCDNLTNVFLHSLLVQWLNDVGQLRFNVTSQYIVRRGESNLKDNIFRNDTLLTKLYELLIGRDRGCVVLCWLDIFEHDR